MAYTRSVGGTSYWFTSDTFTLAPFAEVSQPTAVSEDYRTVARWDLSRGEAAALGIGQSRNPDKAEGFLYFDAQDGADAAISGKARIVVENTQNDEVAKVYQADLDQLRSGSAAPSDRRNRMPFPYQALRNGKGEVGHPYQIAIQIKTNSGSATFSKANSTLVADGYEGTQVN